MSFCLTTVLSSSLRIGGFAGVPSGLVVPSGEERTIPR
jgi:hypothetical protein